MNAKDSEKKPEKKEKKEQKKPNFLIEKIGGTCMSEIDKVVDKIILNKDLHKYYSDKFNEEFNEDFPAYPYGRAFVVSAFGGVTDKLVGDKKTGKGGIFQWWESFLDFEEKKRDFTQKARPHINILAPILEKKRVSGVVAPRKGDEPSAEEKKKEEEKIKKLLEEPKKILENYGKSLEEHLEICEGIFYDVFPFEAEKIKREKEARRKWREAKREEEEAKKRYVEDELFREADKARQKKWKEVMEPAKKKEREAIEKAQKKWKEGNKEAAAKKWKEIDKARQKKEREASKEAAKKWKEVIDAAKSTKKYKTFLKKWEALEEKWEALEEKWEALEAQEKAWGKYDEIRALTPKKSPEEKKVIEEEKKKADDWAKKEKDKIDKYLDEVEEYKTYYERIYERILEEYEEKKKTGKWEKWEDDYVNQFPNCLHHPPKMQELFEKAKEFIDVQSGYLCASQLMLKGIYDKDFVKSLQEKRDKFLEWRKEFLDEKNTPKSLKTPPVDFEDKKSSHFLKSLKRSPFFSNIVLLSWALRNAVDEYYKKIKRSRGLLYKYDKYSSNYDKKFEDFFSAMNGFRYPFQRFMEELELDINSIQNVKENPTDLEKVCQSLESVPMTFSHLAQFPFFDPRMRGFTFLILGKIYAPIFEKISHRVDDWFSTCHFLITKGFEIAQETEEKLNDLMAILKSCYLDSKMTAELRKIAKETLVAVGERYSASVLRFVLIYNKLKENEEETGVKKDTPQISVELLDMSDDRAKKDSTIEERITQDVGEFFEKTSKRVLIISGFVSGRDKIMDQFDRGYSEITFSKVSTILQAKHAVIHKEFDLSSADPKIVAKEKIEYIKKFNYLISAQLADVGMEAIHPKAAHPMKKQNIVLHIRNAFSDDYEGTVISQKHQTTEKTKPKVEIITGNKKVFVLEVRSDEMVESPGFESELAEIFGKHKMSYILKSTDATSISHVFMEKDILSLNEDLEKLISQCEKEYNEDAKNWKTQNFDKKSKEDYIVKKLAEKLEKLTGKLEVNVIKELYETTKAENQKLIAKNGGNEKHANEKPLEKKYELVVNCAAIVCVIGSKLNVSETLGRAIKVLNDNDIKIKCMSVALQGINLQFVIDRKHYEKAIQKLHDELIVVKKKGEKK